jgi:hypothetical protein
MDSGSSRGSKRRRQDSTGWEQSVDESQTSFGRHPATEGALGAAEGVPLRGGAPEAALKDGFRASGACPGESGSAPSGAGRARYSSACDPVFATRGVRADRVGAKLPARAIALEECRASRRKPSRPLTRDFSAGRASGPERASSGGHPRKKLPPQATAGVVRGVRRSDGRARGSKSVAEVGKRRVAERARGR